MPSILVTGAPGPVEAVCRALHPLGADAVAVTDLAAVPEAAAAAGPAAFESYVQLPVTFRMTGDTAIQRVHHFYAEGVLARFAALDAALPALTPTARLIFVLGTLPPEADTADDHEARRALTRILADAARGDMSDGHLAVRVVDATAAPEDIARVALGLDPARHELMERLADLSYADWRTELLGLASVQT